MLRDAVLIVRTYSLDSYITEIQVNVVHCIAALKLLETGGLEPAAAVFNYTKRHSRANLAAPRVRYPMLSPSARPTTTVRPRQSLALYPISL